MQGFITNSSDVTGITGSIQLSKAILLHEDSSADVFSKALPNSCYLSHLDIITDITSGSPTKLTAFLSYDAAGNDVCTGLAEGMTGIAGLTDTSLLSTSVALDVYVTRPSTQTTEGKLYLHIRHNKASGEITLKKARLHWVVRETI
tara:strand:- start:651 stop:1088 length:438 start_codon:yes stop_codon:yes gene_type:complete